MQAIITGLNAYIGRQSKLLLLSEGILITILVGYVDYLLGWELSFAIGFLLPVAFASWFIGRSAGVFIALLSAAARLWTIIIEGHPYASLLFPFWNVTIRLFFFLVTAYLISGLKFTLEREKEFSRMDYLTGLYNRRLFYEMAEGELSKILRHKRPLTVVFMDIDFFKLINDRFGHETGDLLLRKVSEIIKKHVRILDIVARIGGDEFGILMSETDSRGAHAVITRVHKSLLDEMLKENWPVTFSFGVATFLRAPKSVTEMLKTADELMYFAKFEDKEKAIYKVL